MATPLPPPATPKRLADHPVVAGLGLAVILIGLATGVALTASKRPASTPVVALSITEPAEDAPSPTPAKVLPPVEYLFAGSFTFSLSVELAIEIYPERYESVQIASPTPRAGMEAASKMRVVEVQAPTPLPRAYEVPLSYNPAPAPSTGSVWVSGYTRQDGTYVQGYYRNADGTSSLSDSTPTPTPAPTLKYDSGSRSNAGYVDGYYRKDGTYVHGYTRTGGHRR